MTPLETIQAELKAALAERAKLDQRIEALQKSARLLEPIYAPEERRISIGEMMQNMSEFGLTRAVEEVLKTANGKPLPPTSVRNALVEAGVELPASNPMAAIHQTLKRLVARQDNRYEAVEFEGQIMYKYVPPSLTEQLAEQWTKAGTYLEPPPFAKTLLDYAKKEKK